MPNNENESLAGLLTPQGNEAVERCPLCARLNSPGAVDHCKHYFGSYWDGEIIWSDRFGAFEEAWDGLMGLIEELGMLRDEPLEACKRRAEEHGLPSKFLRIVPEEPSASSALVELIEFTGGPEQVSDGMAGGAGHSLYIEDHSPVTELLHHI